jgi:hypothetical protein
MTTDATPVPVRRALVTLREGLLSLTEISDDKGGFAFANLPAGRFTLTASRPAYIPATYGSRRPGRPGTAVAVAAGQVLTGLTIAMTRGAAISGTVRDPNGRPAPRVEILVRPAGLPVEAGIPRRGVSTILTDDRGMYRAYGLEPGAYVVAAVPSLHTGSVEVRAMTPAEMDAALRDLQARQPKPTTPPPPIPRARRMYVPVFYPGTPAQAEAGAVTVKAGDDIGGIDIPLALVSAASIEGRIVDVDGGVPSEARVIISGAGGVMPISFNAAPVMTVQPREGRFAFTNVTPGRYKVTGRAAGGTWASVMVTVGGDDVSGLTLNLQPALTFAGRFRFDAGALSPPDVVGGVQISLQPPGGRGGGVAVANNTYLSVRASASGYSASDGSFEVTGVVPGTYVISTGMAASWWLRSAMVDGRDVLDEIIDLDRSISSAVLTFTDKRSELSGTLQTSSAQPALDYDVIVFSADPKHWFAGARRTKTSRPAIDGRYVFTDLPAGEYLVAALDNLDPRQPLDAAFLALVRPAAANVSIGEGARVALDLKIGR